MNSRLLLATVFSVIAVVLSTQLQGQKNLVYPMMDLAAVPLGICGVLWIYRMGINSRLLTYIGQNSLPIYLLQVPLIKYGLLINEWRNDVIGLLATWGLIFLLTEVVVWIRKGLDLSVVGLHNRFFPLRNSRT